MKRRALIITIIILIALAAAGCSPRTPHHYRPPAGSGNGASSGAPAEAEPEDEEQPEDGPQPENEPEETAPEPDLEELAKVIPYVGMPAEYVDYTVCGPHTEDSDNYAYCYEGSCAYAWRVDGELVLRVECTGPDGEVAVVTKLREQLYWDADGLPHMTDRTDPSTWCVSPEGLLAQWEAFEAKRDKTVDEYATAEAYADEFWYHFAEEAYSDSVNIDEGLLWEDCCEMGYLEACEWWYANQPRPKPEI